MDEQKVVIIGTGGMGRETLDIIEEINRINKKWKVLGFIDDDKDMHGKIVRGYPVIGGTEWFSSNDVEGVRAIVSIGENLTRKNVVEKIKKIGVEFCSLIHPSVIMTRYIEIGKGVIIAPGCTLTSNLRIDDFVILNIGVTISHDTIIEDYVNLCPGVNISGNNKILEGAFIGTGAATIQNITIGRWSIIGAGAVVVRDVPDGVVAVGVPAKPIKTIKNFIH